MCAKDHFEGKGALEHVAQMKAKGMLSEADIHGTEVPGPWPAALDAAKETAIVLLLFQTLFSLVQASSWVTFTAALTFSFGWILWKMGRSAWLGWARLERLHRLLAQEKWEIEHNRPQEREELAVLYRAKGFEGELLEDVLDVLMADQERLLRVMVEEEMGLSLQKQEHPLKQGLFAALGSLISALICLIFLPWSLLVGAILVVALSSALSAHQLNNHVIPAIVWNVGLLAVAYGAVFFMTRYALHG
ncbi:MAG: VIT1/CCC1 transporter family protein [Chlamydiia bacterium]|nr:VIT1/CCC1 transporter family protein [Chlamydiia bacterium]